MNEEHIIGFGKLQILRSSYGVETIQRSRQIPHPDASLALLDAILAIKIEKITCGSMVGAKSLAMKCFGLV